MYCCRRPIHSGLLAALLLLPLSVQAQPAPEHRTQNVILVTLDGLRWQEVFGGIDSLLLSDGRYTGGIETLTERFWRPTPQARRHALLPFFWNTIARDGQLYGHRDLGCSVDVTNGGVFSYPGYNEILTGHADDERIRSNAKVPNPNETVLEYANRHPDFEGEVAAFGSWDVFPYIINEVRSGVPVNAGFEAVRRDDLTPREAFLNTLQEQIPSPWGSVRLDAFTHHYALEHLRRDTPRLLYVAYGETDDFAHGGDYDAYITSAYRTDRFIQELWTFAQSHPQYRGRTTLLITTDHGRGLGDAWTGHGGNVAHANEIWIAALGPDADALGEVSACTLYQNQIAATVATLLGLDYTAGRDVGAPLPDVLAR